MNLAFPSGFKLSSPFSGAFKEREPAPSDWAVIPIIASVDGHPANLTIDGACVLPTEERYAHCATALTQGFPVLVGPGRHVVTAPCVLVGSGPSAIPLLEEIRDRYKRGEEIIAVKGAHDWLIKNDIIPRAAIALDPQQARARCFKRRHREVLYICASQMHPDTWEHLRGYRVLVWNSRIDVAQQERPQWARAFLVPCCSTTGNSALYLMHLLGRRNFELYGFDSSLSKITSRLQRILSSVRGRLLKLDGARVARDAKVFEVIVGSQRFSTTAELVQQAQELQPILQSLPNIAVNAHGIGYYQALLAEGKAQGWPV